MAAAGCGAKLADRAGVAANVLLALQAITRSVDEGVERRGWQPQWVAGLDFLEVIAHHRTLWPTDPTTSRMSFGSWTPGS